MAQSIPLRLTPVQAHLAQELPVLRLTLQDTDGVIHRMTLTSTRPLILNPHDRKGLNHLQNLAAAADLTVLEVQALHHQHLEMRAHPPSKEAGVSCYGLI